jgi:hypothetical protein
MRKVSKKKLSLHKETLNAMDFAGVVGGVFEPPQPTQTPGCTLASCTITQTCTFH